MPERLYIIYLAITLKPEVIVIRFLPINLIAISMKLRVKIVLPCNLTFFILFFYQTSGDESFLGLLWKRVWENP